MKTVAARALTRLLAPVLAPLALLRGIVATFTLAPPTLSYPPPGETIDSSGVRQVSEFLRDPALIVRRMRALSDKTFVGDRILRGRATTASGTVAYEQSESIYAPGDPSTIAPGGEFPTIPIPLVASLREALRKVGQGTEVTVESVRRLRMNVVDRALRKLRNNQTRAFDLRVMAKIAAAFGSIPTVAGSDWGTATDAAAVRHIFGALAAIEQLQEGYSPDTVLLDHGKFVEFAGNEKILALLARYRGGEAGAVFDDDVIWLPGFGGGGLTILRQPTGTAITDPLVFDSTQLGSIVRDENDPADEDGVGVETRYYNSSEVSPAGQSEVWRITTKREREPIVQEPQAAVRITGT